MAPKVVGFDKTKRKRITCKECTAIVEYVEKDVRGRSYMVMGESSGHSFIRCPHCKQEIEMPGSSW
jgi:RNase P subunit RPR2